MNTSEAVNAAINGIGVGPTQITTLLARSTLNLLRDGERMAGPYGRGPAMAALPFVSVRSETLGEPAGDWIDLSLGEFVAVSHLLRA